MDDYSSILQQLLRVSELSGLTLRDIDMKERTIDINHQLQTQCRNKNPADDGRGL